MCFTIFSYRIIILTKINSKFDLMKIGYDVGNCSAVVPFTDKYENEYTLSL